MSLTDSRRMWKLAACPEGLHSHDARKLGVSGNPSQRAKDIADHVPFWTVRERRNGRPGSRYYADGYQPSEAVRVRPNGVEVGGTTRATEATNRGKRTPADLSADTLCWTYDWDRSWKLLTWAEVMA